MRFSKIYRSDTSDFLSYKKIIQAFYTLQNHIEHNGYTGFAIGTQDTLFIGADKVFTESVNYWTLKSRCGVEVRGKHTAGISNLYVIISVFVLIDWVGQGREQLNNLMFSTAGIGLRSKVEKGLADIHFCWFLFFFKVDCIVFFGQSGLLTAAFVCLVPAMEFFC
jgi:hypothetical protein